MDKDWILEAQVTLSDSAMEESLIETFGCINFGEKLIRIYVSADRKQIRRDLCIGDKVVDSHATLLPGFLENSVAMRRRTTGNTRVAA